MIVVRSLFEIARETLYLLRRGPIFFPAIVFSVIVSVFAVLAASWGVAEFRRILFDVGGFGFHFLGNIVAVIWSVRVLAVARLDGSLEVQLASPVSRTVWLVGRFLGIFSALILMGILMLIVWQSLMLATGFNFLQGEEISSFALQILGWGVLSAISLFLASFCGLITALFASFALWISGLLTELVASTLHEEDIGTILFNFFQSLSRFWNLQNFNRSPNFLLAHGGDASWWAVVYGFLLIGFFLTAGSLVFSRSYD